MRTSFCLLFLVLCLFAGAQNYTGTWKGTITRDYGTEKVTDSITFDLKQEGSQVKGFSFFSTRPVYYIHCSVKGNLQAQEGGTILTLSETKILRTNYPERSTLAMDKYMLNADPANPAILTGTSISTGKKVPYTHCKIVLHKVEPQINGKAPEPAVD